MELTDQPWDRLESRGWGHLNRSSYSVVVSDPTAPMSSPKVLEHRYSTGYEGGGEPAVDWFPMVGRRIYASLRFKVSDPWTNHRSHVNKLWFLMLKSDTSRGNFNMHFLPASTSGGWKMRMAPQSPEFDWSFLEQNVQEVTFALGEWVHLEVLIEHVSGIRWNVAWWVDGSLAADHADVRNVNAEMNEFQIAPTWGGTGDVKPRSEWIRFDHVYLSRP